MNFLSLSCPSHSTDSSLVSSKKFDQSRALGKSRGEGRGKEETFSFPLSSLFLFEGVVSRLGACASYNLRPFDFIVCETIESFRKFPFENFAVGRKNAAIDVISLIGAPLICLPCTTQFHSLWANQMRIINSTCNTKLEIFCLYPSTVSVKFGISHSASTNYSLRLINYMWFRSKAKKVLHVHAITSHALNGETTPASKWMRILLCLLMFWMDGKGKKKVQNHLDDFLTIMAGDCP